MENRNPDKIKIPLRSALRMLGGYFRYRLLEQVRSISFILLYLIGFQVLVLRTAPVNAIQLSLGMGLVITGLMFFLEGLMLGLMPLGEQVGVKLPQKTGLVLIMVFGLLLGTGSTFAEPAIASLRAAGLSVTPWGAPLLYKMLMQSPELLVAAIGSGVGVAVAFGMLRFYAGFSLKPFVYTLIPLLLLVSAYCANDENLGSILGLAWDAGAVTTGAVTVPLVLALGIGISRAAGKQERATSGFGVVMLASAFPVLAVMLLGIVLNRDMRGPVSREEFYSKNFHASEQLAAGPDAGHGLSEQTGVPDVEPIDFGVEPGGILRVLGDEMSHAVRAVLPLTLLLLLALLLWLRDRPRHGDEVALGIFFAWLGMGLLTSGVRLGLAPLGDQVGRPLPRVFRSVAQEEGRMVFQPFDPEIVFTAVGQGNESGRFFFMQEADGQPRAVRFEESRFDAVAMRYEHILKRPPLFGPELTLAGIGLVLLFAFGLGYGSTLAEPALRALGNTVEDLTVGTIKRVGVVRAVSLGVGAGLVIGVCRILYDLPMFWLLLPPYVLLLPLTFWSEEDFASIAWDCGGVTTGSITVPLVLAMGLGIGGELNAVDGFGVLAMASVYPIISVLVYGFWMQRRQGRSLVRTGEGGVEDE
jgi:hypothetical protein